jgi:biotin carboxylase
VAAGFSLDMTVLERAHGVDAVELALRSAAGGSAADTGTGAPPRRAVTVQLRSTLPPGRGGRVTGRLPRSDGHTTVGRGVEVVAVSGYDPGDRLDRWYDALLATISAGARDTATAARAASDVLDAVPEVGVPHDGPEVCAVLERLASGSPASEV